MELGGRFSGTRIVPAENPTSKPQTLQSLRPGNLPVSPKTNLRRGPHVDDLKRTYSSNPVALSFIETFGILGTLLILMLAISIAWTAWLIVLTIAPNQTANYLMNTAEFDDGDFWLMIDPEPFFMSVSVISLSVVLLSYATVVLKMTVQRNLKCSPSLAYRLVTTHLFRLYRSRSAQVRHAQKAFKLWNDINEFDGRKRKLWNIVHKTIDLAVQAAALFRLLEDGIPTTLCYAYAFLIAVNSLSCATFILFPSLHSFVEIFVDTMFDMVFAVGWPILWLTYSVKTFQFDRAKALLNLEMYPAAWYERQARLMANGSEAAHFLISFDALRMKSGWDLCLRLAMNLSFNNRLIRVVDYLIHQRRLEITRKRLTQKRKQINIHRSLALLFVLTSILAVVRTNQGTELSKRVCGPFPQCVAYAYRWSNVASCPCRALIYGDKRPKTYAEWINPVDVTDIVRELSSSGDLRVIEIINHHLPIWPDELRRCTGLQSIELMYTDVGSIPDWAATFTKLEYLSIEGRPFDRNLVTMPENLFDDMKSLAYLHLAVHQNLVQLPRVAGATNLKMLSTALMLTLEEIPPLIALSKLKRVLITGDHLIDRIPDLSPSVHLSTFFVGDTLACCNGFIGPCDPSHYLCASRPQTCQDHSNNRTQPNSVTKQLLESAVATCSVPFRSSDFFVSPSEEEVAVCGGQMYAQCRTSNSRRSGMCYSSRMQVIACQYVELQEVVRRKEIREGIGQPCDPAVEKWLGCEL